MIVVKRRNRKTGVNARGWTSPRWHIATSAGPTSPLFVKTVVFSFPIPLSSPDDVAVVKMTRRTTTLCVVEELLRLTSSPYATIRPKTLFNIIIYFVSPNYCKFHYVVCIARYILLTRPVLLLGRRKTLFLFLSDARSKRAYYYYFFFFRTATGGRTPDFQ